jgi:hypothetical protein
VSGVVQGPADSVGSLVLRLIPIGLEELGQGSEAASTVTLTDGRFTFLEVPSGTYLLDARHAYLELTMTSMRQMSTAVPAPLPFPANSARAAGVTAAPPGVELSALLAGGLEFWGQARVEVGDRNVDDVMLPIRKAGVMSGRLEWASGSQPNTGNIDPVLEPADGRRSLGLPSGLGIEQTPGRFTISGLMSGAYLLRMPYIRGTIASITWNGQDYTDRPFDASTESDFRDVVVTLTDATSSVTGNASDAGAAVIAFPVERERWSNYGFNPVRLKSVLATNDGRFRIDGLPVGEYYFMAVPASEERAWIDPAFLSSRAARATRVRIDRADARVAGLSLSVIR